MLAVLFVRRPLALLRDAMRAVEAGNLVARVPSEQSDEVGSVLAEFNAMVEELNQTRQRFIEAAEAREALEAGLQRLDKLVTLGQLSASVAHEIGSPLQVLNGRARALAARGDLPPDVLRSAQILEQQSDRITRIIEQLVSFARRKAANVTAVDLRAAVAAIADLMEPEARRLGLRFEFQPEATLPLAVADLDQVQQVAMNLLSNAFRATPHGGTVTMRLEPGSFLRDGGVEIASVQLVVDDSGGGIPSGVAARMFEPFFTTWSQRGGTGLGLAVVKSIVDDHRGTIVPSPSPSGGTRFAVHFPAVGSDGITAVA
jgi:signal transduction histidine kinase